MASHFASIGLPMRDLSDFEALADEIAPLAMPLHVHRGQYLRWTSACGAEVWLQVNNDNQLIGMVPYYSGAARLRVGITARVVREPESDLDGAFYGWADPQADDVASGCYPFVFDVPDSGRYANMVIPSVVEAHIAAFAHQVTVYPSVDAYHASQSEKPYFASQSFIPSGLFSPDGASTVPPQAYAIFTGHITAAAPKTNSLTQERYYWAHVETFGGSFDVVMAPALCDTSPQPGGVLSGSFWLCGRLTQFHTRCCIGG
jgi:hypothetical protein